MHVPAIRTYALTKRYGAVVGIDDLSLEVAHGEVFGFLGANGSGKTTTIRTLLDLLRPTGGSASILGFDCQRQGLEARRRVGYAPGEMPMYPELTGAAYLTFLSRLSARPASAARLGALLRRFDLQEADLNRRMRDYSHGMKRKLGLIQALMTEPPVLILDEPSSGLDPLMIEAFSETIDELAQAGATTIFLSSHVLSEVDRICHRIALIRRGRLVAVRTLSEIRQATPRRVTIRFAAPVSADLDAVVPDGAAVVSRDPQRWIIDVHGPLGPALARLAALPVEDIEVAPFALEDAILHLLGGR
jgi:ABC-2 type transport system ATP-binding protein